MSIESTPTLEEVMHVNDVLQKQAALNYQDLRSVMIAAGWSKTANGWWVNPMVDVEPKGTLQEAMIACIQKGNKP